MEDREPASPMKREMLKVALKRAGIGKTEFPAWYASVRGKPFETLLAEDVKPLLDAADCEISRRRAP